MHTQPPLRPDCLTVPLWESLAGEFLRAQRRRTEPGQAPEQPSQHTLPPLSVPVVLATVTTTVTTTRTMMVRPLALLEKMPASATEAVTTTPAGTQVSPGSTPAGDCGRPFRPMPTDRVALHADRG